MASELKHSFSVCYCSICGPGGQNVSERTLRRHSVEACAKVASNPDPTPAVSLSDHILNHPKLSKIIVGNFTLLDIVRPMIDIKANNPTVSGDVLDSFICLILRILSQFSVDTSFIPRTFAGLFSLIQPLVPPAHRVTICNVCGVEPTSAADTKCTKCGLDLYDDKGNAVKQYHALPIIPRIKQLMQIKPIARMLKDASNLRPLSNFDALRQCILSKDPDSPVLRLLFTSDGGCPYHALNRMYSVWPGTADILNLPPFLRRDLLFTLLVFLSEGPSKPPDMNTLLNYFAKELAILEDGIDVYDADANKIIKLRVKLELICADGPAFCALHHVPHATAKKDACARCNNVGVRNSILKKQLFTSEKIETRAPMDYDLVRSLIRLPGQLNEYVSLFGRNGVEKFAELTYFDGSCYAIDPMHMGRNIIVKIYAILCGFNDPNVLEAEVDSGRFESSTEYTLSKANLKIAMQRFAVVNIPKNLFDRPEHLFNAKKFPNLKSHTWIRVLTSGVLIYCTKDLISRNQWEALRELTHIFRLVMSYNISADMDFSALEMNILSCVKSIQNAFPLTLRTLQLHLLCHFAQQLRRFGPVATYWMFNSERYMSWVMQRLKLNKANAESTAVNSYTLRWAATLLTAICEPEKLLTPPSTTLHTKRAAKMSPSELGVIKNAWNFIHRGDATVQIKVPGQVETNTDYFESCNLRAVTALKKDDYVYIKYDGQHTVAKILFFCEVKIHHSTTQFAVVQKLSLISHAQVDFPMYHCHLLRDFKVCISLSTLVVSKPLVHVQAENDVFSVYILSERGDYLFPERAV